MVEGAWEWQLAAACVTSKSALDWRCRWRRGFPTTSVESDKRLVKLNQTTHHWTLLAHSSALHARVDGGAVQQASLVKFRAVA